jgi:elongation factor G
MNFPESRIRKSIFTENAAEMEKLITALHKIQEEDPTLKVLQSTETKPSKRTRTIASRLGKIRLEKEFGVKMEMQNPRISYRETITGKADAD